MNKISLRGNVREDDWTVETAIIANNDVHLSSKTPSCNAILIDYSIPVY